jgi:hypothetical protein
MTQVEVAEVKKGEEVETLRGEGVRQGWGGGKSQAQV